MTIFIYGLVDPRTGEVRYIGQSNDPVRRWRGHVSEALSTVVVPRAPGQNGHKLRWMQQLDGCKPRLLVLEQTFSVDEAHEAERRWIRVLRERGVRLTNITSGGDRVLRQRQYVKSVRCVTPGCTAADGDVAQNKPRPMCTACYRLFRKYGDPEYMAHKRVSGRRSCTVVGCTRGQDDPDEKFVHGYCAMHGARYRRHGDPLFVTAGYESLINRKKRTVPLRRRVMSDEARARIVVGARRGGQISAQIMKERARSAAL